MPKAIRYIISPVPGFYNSITLVYYKNINPSGLIRTLEKLQVTLLPKLMSGEVRVKI
ncbi:hypothetical protein ACSSWA_10935 [Melioribacter sp. Ez-97]|uniref:hypothetical protein n=1 Tax=Melioribacter sp. Ez-97 TaxID=3423434 RepID=UPI003ED911E3